MAGLFTGAQKVTAQMVKAVGRAGRFVATEIRRGYDGLAGGHSFYPLPDGETLEALTPGRMLLNVFLFFIGLSPVFWGAMLAVFAHNGRALIEGIKWGVNVAYKERSTPFVPHAEHASEEWQVAISSMGVSGRVIGTVFGLAVSFVWVNLKAIPYTAIGMGRLGLTGQFAGTYQDGLRDSARHGVGIIGTLVGLALGFAPFVLFGAGRVLQHSMYSFIVAVRLSTMVMMSAWQGQTTKASALNQLVLEAGAKQDLAHAVLQDGRTVYRRSPDEAYGLGGLGFVVGMVVGTIPAAIIAVMGTLRFFYSSAQFAFQSIYNSVASKDYQLKTAEPQKEEVPAIQRYGYGWLGIFLGGTLGALMSLPVVMLRVVVNSGRLFVSTAMGMINVTLGRSGTTYGFDLKDRNTNRWAFGLPGMVLAAIVVGIPCAIGKMGYYVAMLAIMALSFATALLPLQRLVRQGYRWASNDMLFSPKNRHASHYVETVMQSFFAALDAFGEFDAAGVTIATLSRTDQTTGRYTFGFLKNVGKFFRKTLLSFDQDTEMEELLKEMLTAMRTLPKTTTTTLSEYLYAVTAVTRQQQEKLHRQPLMNDHQKVVLSKQMDHVLGAVCRALYQQSPEKRQPEVRSAAVQSYFTGCLQQNILACDDSVFCMEPVRVEETITPDIRTCFYKLSEGKNSAAPAGRYEQFKQTVKTLEKRDSKTSSFQGAAKKVQTALRLGHFADKARELHNSAGAGPFATVDRSAVSATA